jgi:hypothetical protein
LLQPEAAYFTAKLVEQGDYQAIRDRHYVASCGESNEQIDAQQLTFEHLSLLFYSMFVGLGAILLQV